jgi:putative two-component system response regulator
MNAIVSLAGASPRPRVLLVEDDAPLCGLLAYMLHGLGYAVHTEETAGAALDAIRTQSPDLVLLDLNLPDGTGQRVLESIRASEHTRFLPVIVMTGGGTREDRLRALGAGVTDFLQKPFDPEELMVRIQALLELKSFTDELEQATDVIAALARTIDARDPYTAGHSERVADYATRLGERIALPDTLLVAVRLGARFHDIGKIGIRDSVLLKPGPLSDKERREMQKHPADGWQLVRHLHSLRGTEPVLCHHHEKLDGSGYPDGLDGDSVPLTARIVSVSDVFDALTTARPYRAAFTLEEALAIMADEARKGWWDAELLDAFRGMIEARVTLESPARCA